jgi:hypothetical protein
MTSYDFSKKVAIESRALPFPRRSVAAQNTSLGSQAADEESEGIGINATKRGEDRDQIQPGTTRWDQI